MNNWLDDMLFEIDYSLFIGDSPVVLDGGEVNERKGSCSPEKNSCTDPLIF